jgi:DNA gyrase subunit A
MAEIGVPKSVFIEDELQKSYLAYAMSMITARALPDVRDGLKPVHRRVLFGMNELSLEHNKPPKKCARVVGDVIGKYHPHGDMPVYDTLVRMAQDFSLRYTMVNGQGNFGSIDGDPPAAMRYTECRMTQLAEEMLIDLDKETVDFTPNYDESLKEPTVMPSKVPFLLINGSTGIAVGMATNMAPHNLGEVVDAIAATIDDPDIDPKALLKFVPGPDFPTGGIIHGRGGIYEAYLTGRGKVILRGRTSIEKEGERELIVITEIPYMINKTSLLEKMGQLARDKIIEGIAFVRDESDRSGMRIVIGLKKDAFSDIILNQLFKFTSLQSTFGINNLALVNMQPRVLTLKELITHFINHRHEVITRRYQFELRKAQERAHILEGLRIAIDNIDAIVALIRSSSSPDEAQARLMAQFGLSELQAKAILEMRLQRLTGLERDKIEAEYQELIARIADLQSILASRERRMAIIKDELLDLKTRFSDPRRTEILDADDDTDINIEDMIADEDMVITMTRAGYVKRCQTSVYRSQGRGGRGVKGMDSKEDDVVDTIFIASAHSSILFFSTKGRCYVLKVYKIPEAGRQGRGRPIVNLLNLQADEHIAAFVPVKVFDDEHFIVIATERGVLNKQPLSAYSNVRRGGINAIGLDEGDRLISCKLTDGSHDIIFGTWRGQAVRFHESATRELGRNTRGVRGITLRGDDRVVSMIVVHEGADVLTVTEKGYGKRTSVADYRKTNRGGSGIINIKCTEKNGNVISLKGIDSSVDIMVITSNGIIIRLDADKISCIGRNTQGVRIINLSEGDRVVDITLCDKAEEGEEPAVAPVETVAEVEPPLVEEPEADVAPESDAEPQDRVDAEDGDETKP